MNCQVAGNVADRTLKNYVEHNRAAACDITITSSMHMCGANHEKWSPHTLDSKDLAISSKTAAVALVFNTSLAPMSKMQISSKL